MTDVATEKLGLRFSIDALDLLRPSNGEQLFYGPLEDAVRRLLAKNRLRPFYLFEAVATRIVDADEVADVDPMFQSLRNLNTPDEYEAALKEAT